MRKRGVVQLVILAAIAWLFQGTPSALAKINVSGGLTHERVADRGETYQGAISVKNTGAELEEVKIYQRDYLFFADGRNIYGDPGTDPRSNAGWIRFSPKRLRIPPGQTMDVTYSVAVPPRPDLVGTYWSLLMVEPIPAGSPEAATTKKNKISFGINVVMNYGIQMISHIGDSGESRVQFADARLVKEEGQRILQVDLENPGERLLRSAVWAELYDSAGKPGGRFEGQRFRIYPGTSARFKIDLTTVETGSYQAMVIADCGDDRVFGTTYTLELQ